jgi:hypothetical protein
MKKPLNRTPVTMPVVVTTLPTIGDELPGPWMSWTGMTVTSSFAMVPVPVASIGVAPTTFATVRVNVSLGSVVVSPFTSTDTVVPVWPARMVKGALVSGW